MNIIDPDNPIPKYLQISAWLKDLIQSGRYERGSTLPSEVELARICQVNRNTLRQAISELTMAGMLRKDKGRGTSFSWHGWKVRGNMSRLGSLTGHLI